MRSLNKTQTVEQIADYYYAKYADADVDVLKNNENIRNDIQADLDSMNEMLDRLGDMPLPRATSLEEAWLLATGVAKRGEDGALYFDVETTSKTKDLWKLSTDTAFEICGQDVESARAKQQLEVKKLSEQNAKDAEEAKAKFRELVGRFESRRWS